jgi:hypothetical protein
MLSVTGRRSAWLKLQYLSRRVWGRRPGRTGECHGRRPEPDEVPAALVTYKEA